MWPSGTTRAVIIMTISAFNNTASVEVIDQAGHIGVGASADYRMIGWPVGKLCQNIGLVKLALGRGPRFTRAACMATETELILIGNGVYLISTCVDTLYQCQGSCPRAD